MTFTSNVPQGLHNKQQYKQKARVFSYNTVRSLHVMCTRGSKSFLRFGKYTECCTEQEDKHKDHQKFHQVVTCDKEQDGRRCHEKKDRCDSQYQADIKLDPRGAMQMISSCTRLSSVLRDRKELVQCNH